MNNDNAFTLLLDLDAMVDTRMGTLITLDKSISDSLPLEAYRKRTMDDWTSLTNGAVTKEVFDAQYAERDLDTLKQSIITGIIPVLMNYIETLKERLFRGVDISSINVDINMYPYRLPGIVSEAYQQSLRVVLPRFVNVNICYLPTQQLSPTFMKAHYSGWVTYDFQSWLAIHHEELLGVPINSLSVISPKLTLNELGTEMSKETDAFTGMDKHGLMEMIMEDFVHLEHIPVVDFCFVLPRTYRIPEED